MKRYINIIGLIGVLLLPVSCDFLNPTENVENPNLTVDAVLGTPNPTAGWKVGTERELAIVYNGLVTIAEIGSDNYVNTETFYNQQFDKLNISYQDADVNTLQFRIADLRESAIKGMEIIIPVDEDATDADMAEFLFYKGWAELLAGEYFDFLPLEGNGEALSSEANISAAIVDFQQAETLVPNSVGYKLALARAYYALGDKTNAVLKANEAITADGSFLRTIEYDAVAPNGPTNTLQNALFDRGGFDDLQPLPRLDFLDPKYYAPSGTEETPIPLQKIEEAHLIIAEAMISDGNIDDAKTVMNNIIGLVATREIATFSDAVEGRTHDNPGSRPDTATVVVRSSIDDEFKDGLVLSRQAGNVSIPIVSGTSITASDIAAVSTEDEALELLYLMRQEIFISEGRRFVDLGLKIPVSEVEFLSNPLIIEEQTSVTLPSFVPKDMDEINYDANTGQCTIKYNLNKILVSNKTSKDVLPFY
ncbi:MAG: hypothetical protein KTR26_10825 [Flammeovirgaceae bacterium]|nr:hypothetical protein [Flammeovirgaceae bacterium]